GDLQRPVVCGRLDDDPTPSREVREHDVQALERAVGDEDPARLDAVLLGDQLAERAVAADRSVVEDGSAVALQDRAGAVGELLGRTAGIAADFLEGLDERPVWPPASQAELREALGGPLPEEPVPAEQVVTELAAAADRGLVAEPGGRYFGFVIGGGVPAALAA